jgi:transposase InsO family protein
MAWRTEKVEDQRIRFVVAVSRAEKDFKSLCAEFSISRPTGYRWWRRYEQKGISSLEDRSRRPLHSPGQTAAGVEEQLVAMRKQRPDWGARKLQQLLRKQGVELPTGTIHRILVRKELIRQQDRKRPAVKRFERSDPNTLWQMDFKGPKGWHQPVGPLSVLDDCSRYALALRATGSTSEAAVREVLQAVFEQCGVPEQMLMDHGCPWWNDQGIRGWTRLAVWLMKQNIRLYFSGYNHPQTQGKVEHFHRSLTAALLRRGTPPDEQRQTWLDEYRHEHNCLRPHQALGMKTPDQVWHKSTRLFENKPKPWNYPQDYETAQIELSGQVKIEGRRYWISGPLAGEQVGLLQAGDRIQVYYRQTLVRELDLRQRSAP